MFRFLVTAGLAASVSAMNFKGSAHQAVSRSAMAAETSSAKYYFNIALPIGKRSTHEIVQIIKGGTLLELVENRVGDALEQVGLANVRFGWDGRLNPEVAGKVH